MPSRRSSAATSPRSVQAAASRTRRSFSAAENDSLRPDFGRTSTETRVGWGETPCTAGRESPDRRGSCPLPRGTPLELGAASCAAGAGVDLTNRRWEGLGTLGSILRPRYTDFEEKVVSADVGTGGLRAKTAAYVEGAMPPVLERSPK